MNVVWTDEAVKDLRSISRYITGHNPNAAKEVARKLIVMGEVLAEFPERGREGRVPDTRELVVPRLPYTIAYRINGETIEILTVMHQARLWPDRL